MSKKNELEFANFILKFGQERNLLDFAEEIVIPAFLSDLERAYGETRHFFHSVEILNLGNEESPILCIAGRYIKTTVLKTEQVFDEVNDELIKNDGSLRTSPSAVFILILNNHRLIYLSETAYAPNLIAFQTTVKKFIREKYQDFINQLSLLGEIPKGQLYREYDPTLEIVSLTNEESMREFIDQYDLLKKVEIKLLTPNSDIDNNEFLREARKFKDEAVSNITTITHHNGKDGLSKGGVTRQIESALSQGNSKVSLRGTDRQGNKLEGSNENFKVKSQLANLPKTVSGIANGGYEIFQSLLTQGTIRIGESQENISETIKQLWNKIRSNL